MLCKWIALRENERKLLVAGAFWVLMARAVLRIPPESLPAKQRALDALAQRLPRLSKCTVADAKWAVTAAARRLPNTVCLPWALALRGLLSQSGIASRLRIGVAVDDRVFKAHAWVECGDCSLSWNESVVGYTVLETHVGRS
jgi:hypothetical protein